MKKVLICLLSLTLVTGLNACDPNDDPIEQPTTSPNPEPDPDPQAPVTGNRVKMTVGSTVFTITLQENATAEAFKQLLPLTMNMAELHNNEKYSSQPSSLPTNASSPGTIQNGDLMLYGSNTLVLFYKTFSTSYSYTRIGHVDNPSELEKVLGTGSITVTFEMQE